MLNKIYVGKRKSKVNHLNEHTNMTHIKSAIIEEYNNTDYLIFSIIISCYIECVTKIIILINNT